MAWPIQNPTVGALLQRAFGLKGRIRPSLEEFVVPIVSLGDLSEGSIPPVTRSASLRFSDVATPAEFWTGRFEAIGSTICVIRKIHIRSSNGGNTVRWAFRGNAAILAAQANIAEKSFTDGRVLAGSDPGEQLPSGVFTSGTQAGVLGILHGRQRLSGEGTTLTDLGVVGTGIPGIFGFFEMQLSGANDAAAGFITWDEYPLI